MKSLATLSLLLVSHLGVLGAQGIVAANIATGAEPTPQIHTAPLPEGYVAHPDIGVAYKVYDEFVSWIDAEDKCTRAGAQLAVIDTPKKLEYAKLTPLGTGVRHVGIRYIDGKWVGANNQPISSSTIPWEDDEAEPSAFFTFAMISWKDRSGKLMNGSFGFSGDYICEIPLPRTVSA